MLDKTTAFMWYRNFLFEFAWNLKIKKKIGSAGSFIFVSMLQYFHNPPKGCSRLNAWCEFSVRYSWLHNYSLFLLLHIYWKDTHTSQFPTPGLALRSVWEVLLDTHGSDHYPILTSILPSVAEIQPSCDLSHWVFSKENWEQFHDVCMESISEDILEEADPLHSFVEHITKAANDCIPRATTIP